MLALHREKELKVPTVTLSPSAITSEFRYHRRINSRTAALRIGPTKNRNMRKETPYSEQRSQSISNNEGEYRMGTRKSMRGGEYIWLTRRIGYALQRKLLSHRWRYSVCDTQTMILMVDFVHKWFAQEHYTEIGRLRFNTRVAKRIVR